MCSNTGHVPGAVGDCGMPVLPGELRIKRPLCQRFADSGTVSCTKTYE
jgi:hypothetical protein